MSIGVISSSSVNWLNWLFCVHCSVGQSLLLEMYCHVLAFILIHVLLKSYCPIPYCCCIYFIVDTFLRDIVLCFKKYILLFLLLLLQSLSYALYFYFIGSSFSSNSEIFRTSWNRWKVRGWKLNMWRCNSASAQCQSLHRAVFLFDDSILHTVGSSFPALCKWCKFHLAQQSATYLG